MLKPVTLFYDGIEYPIMGIANVIAVEKSKGFGSVLMKQITDYLIAGDWASLGNVYEENYTFYTKCGYSYIPGLLDRFIYKDAKGKKIRLKSENNAIFSFDPNNKLSHIINNKKEVVIKIPLW